MGKKPSKKVILVLIAVALLVLGGILSMMFSNSSYTKILEANWGVALPKAAAEEVYSFSEPSVHGDGIRYHVIDYPAGNESKKVQDSMFQIEKIFAESSLPTEEQISHVGELLKDTEVPADAIAQWNECQLVYMTKEDGSELYLFYRSGTGTIYAVESFI